MECGSCNWARCWRESGQHWTVEVAVLYANINPANRLLSRLLIWLQISTFRCVLCQGRLRLYFSNFLRPLVLFAQSSRKWTGCKSVSFMRCNKTNLIWNFSGNFLVITSTCSVTIAVTLGGINFPWSSAHILSPLVIGLVGPVIFIIYEVILAPYPLVSFAYLCLL